MESITTYAKKNFCCKVCQFAGLKGKKRKFSSRTPPKFDTGNNEATRYELAFIDELGTGKFSEQCKLTPRKKLLQGYLKGAKLKKDWGHINKKVVLGENGDGKQNALSLLEEIGMQRPLDLGFVKPYLFNIVLEKDGRPENESFGGPLELVFTEAKSSTNSNENRIVLKGYAQAEGSCETGGVLVGDNLCFINGIPVGAGCRLLKNSDPSPKLSELCPCHCIYLKCSIYLIM